MSSRHCFAISNFAFFLLCALIPAPAIADTLRISGTGGGLGTMQRIGEAFQKVYPEHSVKVLSSLGTSGGIKALQGGALDLAISARDVTAEEKAAGLSAYKYGTTAFIFISHAKTPVQSLTKESIAAIYSGRQASWSNGQPVRLVLRPKEDSDTKALVKLAPEIKAAVMSAHARIGMILAITDSDSADQVEKTAGAFATSTLALVLSENRTLNIFPLDGVKPTAKALADGSYPHVKDMYAVTGAHPSAAARQFLQFLRSPQGVGILKITGHKSGAAQ